MTQEKFIDIVENVIAKNAQDSVLNNIKNPPGRNPSKLLVQLSNRFNQLNEYDQETVILIANYAIESCLFSFLCVLDGVSAIEDSDKDKGSLELFYKAANGKKNLLNDPDKEYLHNLL